MVTFMSRRGPPEGGHYISGDEGGHYISGDEGGHYISGDEGGHDGGGHDARAARRPGRSDRRRGARHRQRGNTTVERLNQAGRELPPLTSDVATTEAITLACALLRSQDLTPFDMAMWLCRRAAP